MHSSPSLLNLPAELRLKIYGHIFATSPITLCAARRCLPCISAKHPVWHYSRAQLSVLQICRQIYAEARFFPFSINKFVAEDLTDLEEGHFFQRFLPQQVNAIACVVLKLSNQNMEPWVVDGAVVIWMNPFLLQALGEMRRLDGLKRLDILWDGDVSDGAWGSAKDAVRNCVKRECEKMWETGKRVEFEVWRARDFVS